MTLAVLWRRVLPLFIICILCLTACHKKPKPDVYNWRKPGASARDILTTDKYSRLLIEIQHMPGYELDSATLINVTKYLKQLCDKPDGIEIYQSAVDTVLRNDTLSLERVIALEKKFRKEYTDDNTIAIHVLVTNGYDERGLIAGLAYYNTSIVVYGKAIQGSYFGNEQQTFVLEHELGHLMGLVNCGTTMQQPHEDSTHIHHCNNPTCTMNYASGRTELDSNCLADIKAIKVGKVN